MRRSSVPHERVGPTRLLATLFAGLFVLPVVASCTATANITEVYTSIDATGERRRNVFFTDSKEIHCLAEYGSGRTDVTFEGIIRQLQEYDFERSTFANV